ncbi:hypothetical protein TNCV_4774771 [Trichonephila clavipes]|uniref:Secreted protein n=1 Tax=Trichonephila clavipes TaxID=2585209 RepID=A0A8X6URB5_TRICX|nr:hypothetical protein TNCV_4774771 [Trichonephila clavipes]
MGASGWLIACPMGRQLFVFALGVRLDDFGPGEGTVAVCTGSEASRVRTGQWGSPVGSWVFVNFCVHEVCERMSDVD